MDRSREYVKMCKGAEEVQAIWHAQKLAPDPRYNGSRGLARHYQEGYEGSWVCQNGESIILVDYEYETGYMASDIWLPRQDQLQEMVLPMYRYYQLESMLWDFEKWCELFVPAHTSMEQLWLAFVMKKNRTKIWDGEEWIKESEEKG